MNKFPEIVDVRKRSSMRGDSISIGLKPFEVMAFDISLRMLVFATTPIEAEQFVRNYCRSKGVDNPFLRLVPYDDWYIAGVK